MKGGENIEEVARRYTDLEPFGALDGWYTGCCPLPGHDDGGREQGFYIFPPGLFRCEECDRGGDASDLERLCGSYAELPAFGEESTNGSRNGHRDTEIRSSDLGDGVSDELISRFKTAKQATEEAPEQVPWRVRPYVAEGSITEIAGKIKASGKTTFVCRMVECILDGKPFMGQETKRTSVVYLTEQTPTSFAEALEDANLSEREDLHILYWHDMARASWPQIVASAVKKCNAEGAGVLVVDTLAVIAKLKGEDENNAGKAQEVMAPLKAAAAEGLSVIYTRHDRKSGGAVGESGRGSSAFGGDADQLILLKSPEGNQRPTVRTLETLGRFHETPARLVIELTDAGYISRGNDAAFAQKQAMSAILQTLPASQEHAMTTRGVIDALLEQGIKRWSVTAALEKMSEARTIMRVGRGVKGSPHRFYKPVPDDEILSSETTTPNRKKEFHNPEEPEGAIPSTGDRVDGSDGRSNERPAAPGRR